MTDEFPYAYCTVCGRNEHVDDEGNCLGCELRASEELEKELYDLAMKEEIQNAND